MDDEDLDQIELKNGCACSTDLCNGEQQKIVYNELLAFGILILFPLLK